MEGIVNRDCFWGMGLGKWLRGGFKFLFYILFFEGRVDIIWRWVKFWIFTRFLFFDECLCLVFSCCKLVKK